MKPQIYLKNGNLQKKLEYYINIKLKMDKKSHKDFSNINKNSDTKIIAFDDTGIEKHKFHKSSFDI